MTTRPSRKGSHAVTIAQFPKLKVAAARKQAAMLAGKRAMGIDLIADRRKQRQAAIKAANVTTLGDLIASDDGPYAVARRDVDKIKRWKVGLATLRRTLSAHFNTDIHEIERFNVTNARTPPCPGEIIPERWARSSRNPGRHHLGTPGRDRRNPHRTIISGKPTACRSHLRKKLRDKVLRYRRHYDYERGVPTHSEVISLSVGATRTRTPVGLSAS
jgi:hypothetical protein